MSIRWRPDDPRWLTTEPDLQTVDLQVLRQAGIPEPVLLLAIRRAGTLRLDDLGSCELGAGARAPVVYTDLSFLDELEEDPDARPYTWDLPEGCD